MITVHRANERRHERGGKQESWHTFDPSASADPLASGFHGLQMLSESRLPPAGHGPTFGQRDVENITYVLEGALAYDDAMGRSGVLNAGEFRRTTGGVRCTERNASRLDWAHVFQICLRSRDAGGQPDHEQKRFSAAQRRGLLCLVAAPDARAGSLRLREDALVYSALLGRGHHMVHDLGLGRGAWLHLVAGEVKLDDIVLSTGDGAGISGQRALSFTARSETEILLVDLLEQPRGRE